MALVAERKQKTKPLIQITRRETVVTAGPEDMARLRGFFAENHYLLMPRFIERGLMDEIRESLDQKAVYYNKKHKGLAHELCMRNNSASQLMHFLINDGRIYDFIREVTGCPPIGCFHGRVYLMEPESPHHHKWHSDWSHHRMIAMSINLGRQPYQGGGLQLRHVGGEPFREVFNTGYGDALIFRLGEDLEHRVTDVTGKQIKTAFAGWYAARPKYTRSLRSSIVGSR